MDTKPASPKIVKMEQNDVKINLDSTGTKTQIYIYIYIYIHNKIENRNADSSYFQSHLVSPKTAAKSQKIRKNWECFFNPNLPQNR